MSIFQGSRQFGVVAAVVAASSIAVSAARAADTGGQLKWTPHRASAAPAAPTEQQADPQPATPVAPIAPQATATPPRLESVPAAGVASVRLPDGVPPVESLRAPVGAAGARAAGRPRTALPPASRRPAASRPAEPAFGLNVFRTPSATGARPILADESPEAAADRGRVERLGGGMAPRFRGGQRPERLAASVDALPSVMRRGAEGQPIDAPPAGPPLDAETVPAPTPHEVGEPPLLEGPGDVTEFGADEPLIAGGPDGMMLGEYPPQLHVESFYDDPYACEDDDPLCHHSGRICAWLRQFGRPYYGWRWYRDFTAGAGVVAFTNSTDLGFNGNFGVDQFANQGMPFWNAFGVGWQVGIRGTQTNFQSSTTNVPGSDPLQRSNREQVFVTTGFFTRAFEGRGLQGGAVYDYLHDNWLDNTDVSQLRYELSYVWGYHELGFWGATNIGDQSSIFGPITKTPGVASTYDLYTAFYRLQFGDANEWKMWGGATGYGDGIVGSLIRAPMTRSWALEGTGTYLIPGNSQSLPIGNTGVVQTYAPAAWNVALNLVFYPGGRSRRSLSSPYRPLFDVADNGSMIRRITP